MANKRESAHQRVEALMQFWEKRLGRDLATPVVLAGELRQPLLGLDDDNVQWVARQRERCRA